MKKNNIRCIFVLISMLGCYSISAQSSEEPDFNTNYISDNQMPGGPQALGNIGTVNEAIDTYTGALKQTYTDYVFPGNGGMNITITRTYQNLSNAISHAPDASMSGNSVLSAGWDLHFGRLFVPDLRNQDGTWGNHGINAVSATVTGCTGLDPYGMKNPTLELPDGSSHVLYQTGFYYPSDTTKTIKTSQYLSDNHWIGRCLLDIETTGTQGGLILLAPNGWKYTFDKSGAVAKASTAWRTAGDPEYKYAYVPTKIEDMNGNTMTISYRTVNNLLVVDKVNNGSGELTFSYGSFNNMPQLTSISGFGVSLVYSYVGGLLQSVDIAGLYSWQYAYNGAKKDGADINGAYSLRQSTSPLGLVTDYSYDIFNFIPGEFQSHANDAETRDSETNIVVISKKVTGSGIQQESWGYTYYAPQVADSITPNITVIANATSTGPSTYVSRCTVYEHEGYASTTVKTVEDGVNKTHYDIYRRGLLKSTKTYDGILDAISCTGNLLQEEFNSYAVKALLSTQSTFNPRPRQIIKYSWIPLLTENKIIRDGETYTTHYEYQDKSFVEIGETELEKDGEGNPKLGVQLGNLPIKRIEMNGGHSVTTELVTNPVRSFSSVVYWSDKNCSEASLFICPFDPIDSYILVDNGWSMGSPEKLWSKSFYDNRGNKIRFNENGVDTRFTYYSSGDMKTKEFDADMDGVRDVTTFANYEKGVPKNIDLSDGVTHIVRTVDVRGNILTSTITGLWNAEILPRSITTTKTYDHLNRPNTITPPAGDSVSITYPNPNKMVISRGSFAEEKNYDERGKVLTDIKKDTAKNIFISNSAEYDNFGNTIFSSDPYYGLTAPTLRRGVENKYDALGRLRKTGRTDDLASYTTYSYDRNNVNVMRVTSGLGTFLDTMGYLAYGNPDERYLVSLKQDIGNAENVLTTTERLDSYGGQRIESITQGGMKHKFYYWDVNYGPLHLVGEERIPESSDSSLTYLKTVYCPGNVPNKPRRVWQKNQADVSSDICYDLRSLDLTDEKITYKTYNKMGLVDFVGYQDGKSSMWSNSYNMFGQPLTKSGSSNWYLVSNWMASYDLNGNMLNESFSEDYDSETLYPSTGQYQYDSLDHLKRITYPDLQTVDYAPDALGRPTQAVYNNGVSTTNLATAAKYFANGQLQQLTLGNTKILNISQTTNGSLLPDQFQLSGIINLDYDYDGVSNITNIADGISGGKLSRDHFKYDGLSRLKQVRDNGVLNSFGYNAKGDITRVTVAGKGSCAYSYTNDWLTALTMNCLGSTDNRNYLYDVGGGVTSKGGFPIYKYDSAMQLDESTYLDATNNLQTYEYARYDFNGNRRMTANKTWNALPAPYGNNWVNGYGGQWDPRYVISYYNSDGLLLTDQDPIERYKANGNYIDSVSNYRNYIYLGTQLIAQVDDCKINSNITLGICPDADDDHDGLTYKEEIAKGTYPLDADSDDDGVNDKADTTPLGELDTDKDGIPNSVDTDDDNDGINDTIELANGTNPLNPGDSFVIHILAHQSNFLLDDKWVLAISNIPGLTVESLSVASAAVIPGISHGAIIHPGSQLSYQYIGNSYSTDVLSISLSDGLSTRKGILDLSLMPIGQSLAANNVGTIVIDDDSNEYYEGGSRDDILLDGRGDDILRFSALSGNDLVYYDDATPNRYDTLEIDGVTSTDDVSFSLIDDDLQCTIQPTGNTLTFVNFVKDTYRHGMSYLIFDAFSLGQHNAVAVSDVLVMPEDSLQLVGLPDVLRNDINTSPLPLRLNTLSLVGTANVDNIVYSNIWGFESIDITPKYSYLPSYFGYRVTNTDAATSAEGFRAISEITPISGGQPIAGGDRNEILYGTDGVDTLIGNHGSDLIISRKGADTILFNEGDGRDTIDLLRDDALPGDTLVLGNTISSANPPFIRDGWDLLLALPGWDEVRLLHYFAKPQYTHLTLAPDGAVNFDKVTFSNGNVSFDRNYINTKVQAGNSCGFCSSANDVFAGTSGNDVAFGWDGSDQLNGGDGDDQLFGDAGDDILTPGSGTNLLGGGAGADTYVLAADSSTNTIENFDLTTGVAAGLAARDKIQFLVNVTNPAVQLLRQKNDLLVKTGISATSRVVDFFAADGFSELDIQFLSTGVVWDGNCVDFTLGNPSHCIKNRVLLDMIADDGDGYDHALADDILISYPGDNIIHGGPGNDQIFGGSGDDTLYGDAGNDRIEGANGNDTLYGGEDDDVLIGGWGRNQLFGEGGNDTLYAFGPYGVSTLSGGSNDDTYVMMENIASVTIQPEAVSPGVDTVLFAEPFTPADLWMRVEDRNHDGIINDLVIYVYNTYQEYVIENWEMPTSQFDMLKIYASGCHISRAELHLLLSSPWTCP